MSCNSCNGAPNQNCQSRMNRQGYPNRFPQPNYRNQNRQGTRSMNGAGNTSQSNNMPRKDTDCCNMGNQQKRPLSECEKHCDKDGCDIGNEHVDKMMPGMGYVPWQKWEDVCDVDECIEYGTIFKELIKPYVGRGCK